MIEIDRVKICMMDEDEEDRGDGEGGGETVAEEHMALPLAGVTICLTGLENERRQEIVDKATRMGATHRSDLRSDVTHLIGISIQTEKYQFAAKYRNNILFMHPKWIERTHDTWINGEDVLVAESERIYALPIFYKTLICVTNVALEERIPMQKVLVAHGATFTADLTPKVTHLIVAACHGEKYRHSFLWNVPRVTPEWIAQSIARGAALDAKLFDPDIAAEEQGVGAWVKGVGVETKRSLIQKTDSFQAVTSLKVRNTKKRKAMEDGMWNDILSQSEQQTIMTTKAPSINDTYSRQIPPPPLPPPREKILERYAIKAWGFTSDRRKIISAIVKDHGGVFLEEESDRPPTAVTSTYTIISHTVPEEDAPHGLIATEFWIERCLYSKSFVDPSYFLCQPAKGPLPRPGMAHLLISITGFSGIDQLHVSKLIQVLGATFCETFTAQRSLLIAGKKSASQDKVAKALEWNIPVVTLSWLSDIAANSANTKSNYQELKKFARREKSGILTDCIICIGGKGVWQIEISSVC